MKYVINTTLAYARHALRSAIQKPGQIVFCRLLDLEIRLSAMMTRQIVRLSYVLTALTAVPWFGSGVGPLPTAAQNCPDYTDFAQVSYYFPTILSPREP